MQDLGLQLYQVMLDTPSDMTRKWLTSQTTAGGLCNIDRLYHRLSKVANA